MNMLCAYLEKLDLTADWIEDDIAYLSKINRRDIINDYYNIKQKGLNYDYSELPPNSLLILFDNPFKENCYYYNPISDKRKGLSMKDLKICVHYLFCGWGCQSRAAGKIKSFLIQQFFKNVGEVWASSPHLRSKSNLQIKL